MLKLQDFRSRAKGLPDLLPYAALIAPGVILNKDGSFLAAFECTGMDTASAMPDELAQQSARFSNAVKLLGTGWMLHMDAVRTMHRAYPARELGHFPDRVTQLIDDERRAFFGQDRCFATTTRLTLTYKPNYTISKLAGNVKAGGSSQTPLQKHLEFFENALFELQDALSSVLFLERLTEYPLEADYFHEGEQGQYLQSDLLSSLQQCLTGDLFPIRVPATPMYLDELLASEDLTGGLMPKLGDKYISVISLDGLPQESWPAMLSGLESLRFEYRYSSRFICLDQYDAVKEVTSYVKGWNQQIFRFLDQFFNNPNARANRDALLMREDAEQAKADVQGGVVGAGYLSSCIVILDENPELLQDRARELRRAVQSLGFGCRIESINALEAWLGSLPGVSYANVRRPLINTMNLADLLPLSSIWTGSPTAPCPFYPPYSRPLMVVTRNSTPVWFNAHVGDIGHTAIFGPTGSGKSTLLTNMAAQTFGYEGNTVFVFDKGMSFFPLCHGAGGDHYHLGADQLAFAPLQRISDSSQELAVAEEWVASLLRLQQVTITPEEKQDIYHGLELLSAQPPHMRSLTHFSSLLPNLKLQQALAHYTKGGGTVGNLLDSESDNLSMSRFMVFEMEELMNMGEENLIPVITYLFHRIEMALHGQPAWIFLDEAWVFLGNDVFREKLNEWLVVMRKKVCAVVLATQNLTQAKKSGLLPIIAESCQSKLFLSNASAFLPANLELYHDLGLNDTQATIIRDMTPKREYYLVQPQGCTRFEMNLGPYSLAYTGNSDKDSIARIKELSALHGPMDWQKHWESEKGVRIA